jgi:hypothetical protein
MGLGCAEWDLAAEAYLEGFGGHGDSSERNKYRALYYSIIITLHQKRHFFPDANGCKIINFSMIR